MKPANFGPVYAAALYPQLAELFREHGYALAVHGSLARDMDLIAVPWARDVSPHEKVLEAITSTFAVKMIGESTGKEHGRRAWTLSIGFGECSVDISFMPSAPIPPAEELAAMREVCEAVKKYSKAISADLDDTEHGCTVRGTLELVESTEAEMYAALSRLDAARKGGATC